MSDNPKVLKHPYGTYLMVRPEFVLLRDDDLQARIMRIIEGWMEYQKMAWQAAYMAAVNAKQPPPPEPSEYWVTISQSQFIAQLYMFDAGKVNRDEDGKKKRKDEWDVHNAISKATLRAALDALKDDKIIFIRPQPGHEFESAQYTLNVSYVQELEDKLPKNYLAIFGGVTNFECPPVTNFECGTSNNCTPPGTENESPQVQNFEPLIDKGIDTKQTTQNESTYAQSATAFAPHTQQGDEDDGRDNGHAIAHRRGDTSAAPSGIGADGNGAAGRSMDTVLLPAGQTLDSYSHDPLTTRKTKVNTPLQENAQKLHKTNLPAVAKVKAEKPAGPPAEPKAETAWGTRKCLAWFDFWRGAYLIGTYKNSQAATCAKGLAEQYTEAQVLQERNEMENDPYYIARGGCDVCDVANNIAKYIKRRENRKKPAPTNANGTVSGRRRLEVPAEALAAMAGVGGGR